MPKKLDLSASLRALKKHDPSSLRPVSTRVSVRCLRALMEACVRDNLDLAVFLRQILEEQAASGPRWGSQRVALAEDAMPWLEIAIQRVRQAYQQGTSPIDAIIGAPLYQHFAGGDPYQGALAPLITAAIDSVSIQEILDYRTLEVIEQQKQRQHETYAQRLWREAVERAPLHVRPHAEKLKQLELDFHARVRLAWRPDDGDSATPPIVWSFDDWVMQELEKAQAEDETTQSLHRLIRAGFLTRHGAADRPNSFLWEEE